MKKRCLWCKAEFETDTDRKSQKFHSKKCRKLYRYEKHKQARKEYKEKKESGYFKQRRKELGRLISKYYMHIIMKGPWREKDHKRLQELKKRKL